MISGLLSPGEPLFVDLVISNYFNKYRKSYGNVFENINSINLRFGKMKKWKYWNSFGKDGYRQMMKIRLNNLGNLGYEINIYQKT